MNTSLSIICDVASQLQNNLLTVVNTCVVALTHPVCQAQFSVCRPLLLSLSSSSDTNLLDCSSYGLIALALGSSVFIWDSETRALVGCLDPVPGRASGNQSQSISCLCWSRDGRALCIGTRRGDIQVRALVKSRVNEWKLIHTNCGGHVAPSWISSLQWLCLSLHFFSCGMLSRGRMWAVCHHTCLRSELFPGNSSYSAGKWWRWLGGGGHWFKGTICKNSPPKNIAS